MRKEVKELNDAFGRFVERVNEDPRGFAAARRKEYQGLMVRAFALLQRDWNGDKVPKDIALLMATLGSLMWRGYGTDDAPKSPEFEQVTMFHRFFIGNMAEHGRFRFDGDGLLLIDSHRQKTFKIDPRTFDLPTHREIFGY